MISISWCIIVPSFMLVSPSEQFLHRSPWLRCYEAGYNNPLTVKLVTRLICHAVTSAKYQISMEILNIKCSKQKQGVLMQWHEIQQRDDSSSIGCHGDRWHVAMETKHAELFVDTWLWRCWLLPNDDVLIVVRRQNQLLTWLDKQASHLHSYTTQTCFI